MTKNDTYWLTFMKKTLFHIDDMPRHADWNGFAIHVKCRPLS